MSEAVIAAVSVALTCTLPAAVTGDVSIDAVTALRASLWSISPK